MPETLDNEIIRKSPTSFMSENSELDDNMDDQHKKRKRLSLQEGIFAGQSTSYNKGKQRSVTMGPLRTSPEQESVAESSKKGRGKASASGLAGFTSCEACRKGKRFAIECVRVKAVRRKGPAPVAVSDAAHGYSHDSSLMTPDTARKSSMLSENGSAEFERKLSANYSPSLPIPSPANSIHHLPDGVDQVVSGPIIDNILNLFFDYVPRGLVNLDKMEVEDLARKCVRVARAKMAYMWDDAVPISSSMTNTSSSEGIVHLFLGNNTAHVVVTAQANQLALALRLNEESRTRAQLVYPAIDWEAKLRAQFVDFFRTAGDKSHALNSFLVMQGNILVTQHVVRLVLLQTHQSLLSQLAMFTPVMPPMGPEETAENIAFRFVGIHLMEASNDLTGAPSHSQKLLMQFLSVLSVIEGMYSFGKDISAE
ncbi:uncharacterized protein L201_004950 [Kwoniella dendrophila CBS 6074]|uniref:Transcription factor domain-containing protein n=1 Tax=Kwoniella dendrophila CBS 6074 TaxID=1295534 RepID=A0AAX4JZK7_9TREE